MQRRARARVTIKKNNNNKYRIIHFLMPSCFSNNLMKDLTECPFYFFVG